MKCLSNCWRFGNLLICNLAYLSGIWWDTKYLSIFFPVNVNSTFSQCLQLTWQIQYIIHSHTNSTNTGRVMSGVPLCLSPWITLRCHELNSFIDISISPKSFWSPTANSHWKRRELHVSATETSFHSIHTNSDLCSAFCHQNSGLCVSFSRTKWQWQDKWSFPRWLTAEIHWTGYHVGSGKRNQICFYVWSCNFIPRLLQRVGKVKPASSQRRGETDQSVQIVV